MIKELSRIDEARQKTLQALQDAYGRTQATPDGMMCRMGRIDRAYQLKAKAGDKAAKYETAIKAMRDDAQTAFANADRLTAIYQRVCKSQNITADMNIPTCDCSYCQTGLTTGRMNHADWERFVTAFGATASAN